MEREWQVGEWGSAWSIKESLVNGYRLVGNGVKRVVFSFSSSFLLGGMGGSGHLVSLIFFPCLLAF